MQEFLRTIFGKITYNLRPGEQKRTSPNEISPTANSLAAPDSPCSGMNTALHIEEFWTNINSEMTPPITESIRQVRPDVWIIGSLFVCEKSRVLRNDTLASWKNDKGHIFCLRPRDQTLCEETTDASSNLIHQSGTSGAVWVIGGVFCKAKAWIKGTETEAETLRYAWEKFDVPMPEIVYDWIDISFNRSFLIIKPVSGQTLQKKRPSLSSDQRRNSATQVARYCQILAKETSNNIESATGCGIRDPFLLPTPSWNTPSWKSVPPARLTKEAAQCYFHPMNAGDTFHFFHADLNPTNVMVANDGGVTGILDWESAAFYPRFWISTKPKMSYGFILEDVDGDRWGWSNLLSDALQGIGFVSDFEGFSSFSKRELVLPE